MRWSSDGVGLMTDLSVSLRKKKRRPDEILSVDARDSGRRSACGASC